MRPFIVSKRKSNYETHKKSLYKANIGDVAKSIIRFSARHKDA